jgi:hypothetical protein
MHERSLYGHIITSAEELERCKSLFEELRRKEFIPSEDRFERYAEPQRINEVAAILCEAVGIPFPSNFQPDHPEFVENSIGLHLSASENALMLKEKGINVGSEMLCGPLKAKAVVKKIHWSYDLIVEHLDPRRKQKIRLWRVREVILSDSQKPPIPQPVIAHLKSQTVILERTDRSWSAYFDFDDRTRGFGRSESEAIGSLYINNIGKAILKNPDLFGLTIITKPT